MNTNSTDKYEVLKYAVVIILISIPDIISYYATVAFLVPMIILRISMMSVFLMIFYCTFKDLSKYQSYLMFCFVIMLFLSVINVTPTTPFITIITICSLMVFGTFHKKIDIVFFNRALTICVSVYIPLIIYAILKTNLDINIVLRRGYTWTELFAYATLTPVWVPFLFSSILTKRKILLAFLFWLLAVFVALTSLKRQIIIDSALAFVIILFVASRLKDKIIVRRFAVALILLIIVVAVGLSKGLFSGVSDEVFNAMSDRFSETTDDIESFDRFVESKMYFQNEAGVFDIVFGKGFLSAHHSLPEEHYFLHVGWTNFIFKGGLLLFFVLLSGYRKVFHVFFHPNKYSLESVFCSMYCVYCFFALLYVNLMGYGVSLYLFFYCLTQINDTRNKKIITNVVAQ